MPFSSTEGTICIPCPVSCTNCNANLECENCQEGYFLTTDTRTCSTVCSDGQYSDKKTRTCQPCHPDCDTCIGPRDTQCAKCKKDSFYFQRKCTKRGCPAGYFPDLYISECAPCPKGCLNCLGPDSCEVCETGWTLINSKICVPTLSHAQCSQGGMYWSNHTGQCENCHSQCGTCFDGTKDGCLSCEGHKPLLHINTCLEGHHCPPMGTFQFNTECRHCAHACSQCSSLQKCDTCHNGYYLTQTGHCVPACPEGQYADPLDRTCKPCPPYCKACLNQTICSQCPEKDTPLLLPQDGSCVDRCPLGSYKDQDRCLPCHGSCHSCSGPSKEDCLSCPPGTRLRDYSCQSCSLGYYFEGRISNKCQRCHTSCSTCSGPLESDCMSCSETNLHLDENNTCVPCCNQNISSSSMKEESLKSNSREIKNSCCECDARLLGCLHSTDGHGTIKRSNWIGLNSHGQTDRGAPSNFFNGLVIFLTALIVPIAAYMAYKKYYKRIVRLKKPSRAKWRRHLSYEKVNDKEEGCDNNDSRINLMDNENDNDSIEDSEDEVLITQYYGEERRRLLYNNHSSNDIMTPSTNSSFTPSVNT